MSINITMDNASPHPHHQQQQHQNWLGFSLSNSSFSPHHHQSYQQHHHHDSADNTNHHHLSLFESFPSFSSNPGGVVDASGEDDHYVHAAADGATTESGLSMFACGGCRKLEDFLGGGIGGDGSSVVTLQTHLGHYPAETEAMVSIPEVAEYDSELKTIAASFLRGFSSSEDQPKLPPSLQQQLAMVPPPLDSCPKKNLDTFGQRTSIYRGVTRHRWTGRYEAHLWDNSCRREGQSRKGRQAKIILLIVVICIGGYDKEDKAARAYDLAALKYWGPTTTTNFPVSNYEKELEEMKHMTRQEFVASLRRKSSGFSRGASIYRGVTRHHQHGRWQARIGRVAGNKDLYLGTFSTQEEAAEAYDIAAIKFRGLNAVTNFDMSRYDVKSIMNSTLPIGGMSGKSRNGSDTTSDSWSGSRSDELQDPSSASSLTFNAQPPSSTLSFAIPIKPDTGADCWSNMFATQTHNQMVPLSNSNNSAPPIFALPETSGMLHSIPSMMSYNMDFTVGQSAGIGNPNAIANPSGLFIFNGSTGGYKGFQHQHQISENSAVAAGTTASVQQMIPFATPIGLGCNNNNKTSSSTTSNSGSNSWNSKTGSSNIAPSLHSIQAAKSSLSVLQTPIFGME
ncbi:hypothetical protein SAY87_009523 [Trapa incisa]|uniref:AP2/ERF domain-containing protein n=1 Tax=Trapa incisa TaxID=236973 RepID=A0AAN7JWP1_9MYRT|nr:hypothetical protein SAY87_009523 [Trapa incisa]